MAKSSGTGFHKVIVLETNIRWRHVIAGNSGKLYVIVNKWQYLHKRISLRNEVHSRTNARKLALGFCVYDVLVSIHFSNQKAAICLCLKWFCWIISLIISVEYAMTRIVVKMPISFRSKVLTLAGNIFSSRVGDLGRKYIDGSRSWWWYILQMMNPFYH